MLGFLAGVLNDPRNSWIGLGPMAKGLGLGAGLLGQLVYHGSPHKFDKFALSKIGTGEGAQAFGHGLYFAENPEVAQQYKNLAPRQFIDGAIDWANPVHVAIRTSDLAGGPDAGIARLRQTVNAKSSSQQNKDVAQKAIDFLQSGEPFDKYATGGGHTYHVDLPDDAISRMLDWDKPLSQQSQQVQQSLKTILDDVRQYMDVVEDGPGRYYIWNHNTGYAVPNIGYFKTKDAAQQALDDPRGSMLHQFMEEFAYPSDVSERLKSAGVPGIRYLDAGSRGAGHHGTSNYVVFDENLPVIKERR